jgi:hypothetical protein
MTVRHVVWFKFKDGVSDDRMEQHLAACRSLVGPVPPLISLECGKSYVDRAGGLTHCIIVTVRDRQGLNAYLEHPVHVPVATALKADVAELKVMDIEV